jgi:hypothetical protein
MRGLQVFGGAVVVLVVAPVPVVLALSSGGLTGFGATRAAWNAHHSRDVGYASGCCFFPKNSDGSDRYITLEYQSGRVASYEMLFKPAVPRAVALSELHRDVPSDARRVWDVKRATCEFVEYRSRALKAATGVGVMDLELSRTPLGGAYSGVVGDVLVGVGYGPSVGC